MDRRDVLAGSGVALATLASGCAGVLSDGSEQEPSDDTEDEETEDESPATDTVTAAGNTFEGEKRAVARVFRQNVRATEEGRLQSLRETLHPDSPIYDNTIQQTRQLWEQYELGYSVTIHSITVEGDEAAVEYEQVTRATGPNGDEFRDNRIRATSTFRVYQGEWRIYGTQIGSIDYLE